MKQQMWKSFPRDLEFKMNGLLDEAVPNALKAFQLFKRCQSEGLWQETFERFSAKLNEFCSIPRIDRSKSAFDCYLERPMDSSMYQDFHLTFRTAQVEDSAIRKISFWAHNVIRINLGTESDFVSIQTLDKVIHKLTHPSAHDKETELEFSDFCEALQETMAPGLTSESLKELNNLVLDLRNLDLQSKQESRTSLNRNPEPSVLVDWIFSVKQAVFANQKLPTYSGPEFNFSQQIHEFQKLVTLYNLLRLSDIEKFVVHKESVRRTVAVRCDELLDLLQTKMAS